MDKPGTDSSSDAEISVSRTPAAVAAGQRIGQPRQEMAFAIEFGESHPLAYRIQGFRQTALVAQRHAGKKMGVDKMKAGAKLTGLIPPPPPNGFGLLVFQSKVVHEAAITNGIQRGESLTVLLQDRDRPIEIG